MSNLTYHCLNCGAQEQTDIPAPAAWARGRMDAPRRLCPVCGCASYPEAWHWWLLADIGNDNRMDATQIAWENWSNCPNAQACEEAGHYAADCERGAVMPKCFASIHQAIRDVAHRLAHLERTPRARRG